MSIEGKHFLGGNLLIKFEFSLVDISRVSDLQLNFLLVIELVIAKNIVFVLASIRLCLDQALLPFLGFFSFQFFSNFFCLLLRSDLLPSVKVRKGNLIYSFSEYTEVDPLAK